MENKKELKISTMKDWRHGLIIGNTVIRWECRKCNGWYTLDKFRDDDTVPTQKSWNCKQCENIK